MENKKHIYIIDGNSLLFRAYYATSYGGSDTIMRTSSGIPTNAIFAFSNMITKILASFSGGESIFVGFDADSKTFRKEEFEDYKANRKPTPEDLVKQFPISRELLEVLGVLHYEEHGVEADDLCGTVATLAEKEGYIVDVYTSDKDYLQLVSGSITVNLLKTGLSNMNPITPEEMVKQFGFSPKQIIDFKGLRGDSSDNLPGIKGIGDKGATDLIKTYGSFDAIIDAAKQGLIKGKLKDKIIAGEEMGRKCYELATIKRDCALPFSLDDLLYEGYDFKKAEAFAAKYELKSFLSRLPSSYRKGEAALVLPKAKRVKSLSGIAFPSKIGLALDMEGPSYHEEACLGFAVSDGRESYYLETEDAKKDPAFKALLLNKKIIKNVYDSKETKVVLNKMGLTIEGIEFDFLLSCYLIDTSSCASSEQCVCLLGAKLPEGEISLFSNGNEEKTAALAFLLLALESKAKKSLDSLDASALYEQIEFPLSSILAEMEMEGFPAHKEELQQVGEEFKAKLKQEEAQIYALAGHSFNISSPKQVGEVLYNEMGLSHDKALSTSAEKLQELSYEAPICGHILAYRKYAKLIGTYVDGLLPHIQPDGKIHTCFNQAQTSTGRLSSSNPNLQNISARDEEGKKIRKAFYYDDERYLLSIDYHQIELRILAALSGCELYKEVFREGRDVHEETARRLFKLPALEKVSGELRRRAKAINFAIIYGTTPFGLSEQIGCSPKEASQVIESFYATYPEIKEYLNKTIDQAQKKGYVETILGRRRYLKDLTDPSYMKREAAKRAALNAPVQGSAADLIKTAMLQIDAFLKEGGYRTKMILQIHDELIFSGPKEELEVLLQKLSDIMVTALHLSVPLTVEATIAKSWYELKE